MSDEDFRIYSEEEVFDHMAANLYCHESGVWGGRATEAQREHNRQSFERTLEINDAEYRRVLEEGTRNG